MRNLSARRWTAIRYTLLAGVALLEGGCTLSIALPQNNSTVNSPVAARVQWSSLASESNLQVSLAPNNPPDITTSMPFNAQTDAAGSKWTATMPLTQGTYTLTAKATLTAFGGFSNDDTETVTFTVPPPPAPPPSAVNTLTPSSGVVGTNVAIGGAGFDPSHPVAINAAVQPSRFVSANEIDFTVPQLAAPAADAVSVDNVQGPNFNIAPAALGVSPAQVSAIIGQSNALNISLPLPAPPGGVTLSLSAMPANLIQMASTATVSQGQTSQSVSIQGRGRGAGTITLSGNGFTTLSLPFSSMLGPAQCSARASANGGVDLVSLATSQVIAHLQAAETPGRIVTSPDGKRAAAQFTTGVDLIDLVACPSSDLTFVQTSIPFVDLSFTGDSTWLVADWYSNAGGFGVDAFETLRGAGVLQDASGGLSVVGFVPGSDGTTDYVFAWFGPQGPPVSMTIYRLAEPHASQCSLGQVPSNSFSVSMNGSEATLQFQSVPAHTWVVDAQTCRVIRQT